MRSDDYFIHRLGNRRRIRRKKDQFHPIKRWHGWVNRAIMYNQTDLPLLGTKVSINFFSPFFKQFRWHPTFWLCPIATWNVFHTFKTSWIFYLPIRNIGSLSLFTLSATIPVKQTLLCLPPVHFLFLKWYVLLGTHWYNRPPNSSALKISWSGYLERIVRSVVSSHGSTISSVTDLASPEIVLNTYHDIPSLHKKKKWELL